MSATKSASANSRTLGLGPVPGLVLGLTLALLLGWGCGGSGLRANVSPGTMPSDGTYTGVWQSPQYGEMHMVQTGSAVVGEYRKDERQGSIQGTVQGDLLRFEWEERRYMVQGRPSTSRGRGYFQYLIDDSGAHNILGEWGVDNNEVGGGPWRAYKLRNRRPELRRGGQSDEGGGGADFDDQGDDSGDDFGGGDDFGSDEGGSDPGDPGDDLNDLDNLDL